MLCPRCNTEVQTIQAEPRPGARALSVDTCATCSGLWLDGAELAPALPVLAALPQRMAEITQTATVGSFACPRCRGLMLAFDLLGTPIDLCRDCGGVWLDGGEFAALAAQRDSAAPRHAVPKEVACRGCGAVTPLGETYYSDRGLVCGNCHSSTDSLQAIDDRAEGAKVAYANYAAQQGAIMAQNRAPVVTGPTTEAQLSELRDEVRWLRRHTQS